MMTKSKKKFQMPHIYVLLVALIIFCVILTYIMPAGEFQRTQNASGVEVIVPGTFKKTASNPVGPFQMVQSVYQGMIDAGPVIFFVFIAYASIGLMIDTGAFNGLMSKALKVLKGKMRIAMIPIFITALGVLSSTIGVSEEMFPFVPIFVSIAIAMGYDAIVGMAIVGLGTGIGYSAAVVNPFNVGMAQSIAGLPLLSGSWYRVVSHIAMIIVTSIYLMRYADKITKDPSKSLVYGDDFSEFATTDEDLEKQPFGKKEIAVLIILILGVFAIVYGAAVYKWYFSEICAVFLIMGLSSSFVMGKGPNDIGEAIGRHFAEIAVACMMIGVARGVLMVLQDGHIIDSIVYYLSLPLSYLSKWIAAPSMLLVQMVISFVIPSGSGQAVTSMPIMAPVGDLLGIERQVSVLAFQFADGVTNAIWPTASAPIICGLAGIKIEKWWRFVLPLFAMLFALQVVLVIIAVAIGYH